MIPKFHTIAVWLNDHATRVIKNMFYTPALYLVCLPKQLGGLPVRVYLDRDLAQDFAERSMNDYYYEKKREWDAAVPNFLQVGLSVELMGPYQVVPIGGPSIYDYVATGELVDKNIELTYRLK